MITLSPPAVNVMAVAVVLAFLAFVSVGRSKDVLLASSAAVAVFGIYRFAVTAIPWLWLAADSIGRSLGAAAGGITGRPLWIGSAFAGLDFLVLTSAVWALYLPCTRPPRMARAIYGFLAILGGHLVYLVLLSYVPDFLAAFPQPAAGAGESSPSPAIHSQGSPVESSRDRVRHSRADRRGHVPLVGVGGRER